MLIKFMAQASLDCKVLGSNVPLSKRWTPSQASIIGRLAQRFKNIKSFIVELARPTGPLHMWE